MPASLANPQPTADGDAVFLGVVDRGEPERVPPGYVSAATNMTFADGTARTREGSFLPSAFLAAGLNAPLYGAGIFSDPYGVEWTLLAEAGRVVQCRDGHTPRVIAIPEALAARVAIVQGFDEVLLFRGKDPTPWVWDGLLGTAFQVIPQDERGDGTKPIPNGPDLATRPGLRPCVVNSRMVVPHGRNSASISDIEDYARHDEAYASYNLSAANDDTLAGLLPMGQSGLLALKDGSVALIRGISATLSGVALSSVTGAPGCIAGATARAITGGVLYLAETGLQRLAAADETRVEADPVLLSAAIERIFDRIHAPAVGSACAAVHGEYYYLSVPLDRSTRNNALLPLNLRTSSWEGIHTFPTGVCFDELIVTDYQGERRLFGIDFTNARVHLLYEGSHDRLATTTRYEPAQSLTTRAYRFEQLDRKTMRRGKLHCKTWWANVSVSAKTGAVNDAREAAVAFAPDRTKYKTFGVAAYDATNVNNDHATAGREDYSIEPPFHIEISGEGVIYQGPYTTPGEIIFEATLATPLIVGDALFDDEQQVSYPVTSTSTTGSVITCTIGGAAHTWPDSDPVYFRRDASSTAALDFDLEQTQQLPLIVRQIGISGALTITNTRGRIAITGIELEGIAAQRNDSRA